ncbi:hypothetical protein [Aliiroseovarius sediminis]|nr:hypothetical protein [Aliiroseovarius sediminis]MCI2393309.1 hypothetical protein [Aliiroseovarius sediminis]
MATVWGLGGPWGGAVFGAKLRKTLFFSGEFPHGQTGDGGLGKTALM